jgi:hypothetical protein
MALPALDYFTTPGLTKPAAKLALDEVLKAVRGRSITVKLGDETTAITVGDGKFTLYLPMPFVLTEVRASLATASGAGAPEFRIRQNGVSILTTNITIDAGETSSLTAAVPPEILTAALADGAAITYDIVAAGAGAKGLQIDMIGYRG